MTQPSRPRPHRRPSRPRTGFALLEVLVAIVVLSFGLLGAVGLQAAALQSNREARLQATGVQLAREIAELMRANKAVAVAAGNAYLVNFTGTVPGAGTNCFTATCTAAQVADWDVQEWLTRVRDALPGARVRICFDAQPYDGSGNPRWDCTNAGGVAVIKIGWTRRSTNLSADNATPFDEATRPAVVIPALSGADS